MGMKHDLRRLADGGEWPPCCGPEIPLIEIMQIEPEACVVICRFDAGKCMLIPA